MKYRMALAASLVLIGCATSFAPPPTPPLVAEELDGSQEYQWTPFRWESGKKLVYTAQSSTELTTGGHTSTQADHVETILVGTGKTAKGLTQVEVSIRRSGGVQISGTLLMDDAGRVQDVIAPTREAAADVKRAWNMDGFSEHFSSRPMTLNETYPVTGPTSEFLPVPTSDLPLEEFLKSVGPTVTTNYTFVGDKRLGTTRVAAIRVTLPDLMKKPFEGYFTAVDRPSPDHLRLDSMKADGVTYLERDHGYPEATYAVVSVSGQLNRQPLVVRMTMVVRLDRRNSQGI